MTGTSRRRFGMKTFAQAGLLALLAGMLSVRAVHAGDALDAGEKRQRKMMALAIRIAQAEGNEGKVKKYKSFARQQRARNRPRPDSNSR